VAGNQYHDERCVAAEVSDSNEALNPSVDRPPGTIIWVVAALTAASGLVVAAPRPACGLRITCTRPVQLAAALATAA
jgi:hypothetical protein